MDAHERRDVAVADVRGAYLHAENDDDTIMVLEDDIVGILESVDAVYTKFIHTDQKGKRKLYVRLTKALYGLVRSALLWYNLFSSTLINDDYVLNNYDACIANKVVNGKQLTIQFYVDDLKISHVDPKVVDKALSSLEERFGKLEASRGCNHEFLGMSIVFNKEERAVSINMKSYIEKAVREFGEDLSKIKPVVSAAASYLFSYPVDDCPLTKSRSETFHTIVALLYLIKVITVSIFKGSSLSIAVLASSKHLSALLFRTLKIVIVSLNGKQQHRIRFVGPDFFSPILI